MGVRQAFGSTAEIYRVLNDIKSEKVARAVSKDLGDTAHGLTMECFERERDPNGVAWKKLARPTPRKILQDTKRLIRSIEPRSSARGFELSTDVEYAAIHNYGGYAVGRPIPKRQYIPSGSLSSRWTKAFQDAAAKALRRWGAK